MKAETWDNDTLGAWTKVLLREGSLILGDEDEREAVARLFKLAQMHGADVVSENARLSQQLDAVKSLLEAVAYGKDNDWWFFRGQYEEPRDEVEKLRFMARMQLKELEGDE